MKALLILLLSLFTLHSIAQNIVGHIVDERKEPMLSVELKLFQNGNLIDSTSTDFDGNFKFKTITTGIYDLVAFHLGFDTLTISNIILSDSLIWTKQNLVMIIRPGKPKNIVYEYRKQLAQGASIEYPRKTNEINKVPALVFFNDISSSYGLRHFKRGSDVSVNGGNGTIYIIDGLQVQGNSGVDMGTSSIETIDWTNPPTFIFTREDLSQLTYRDISDLQLLIPTKPQNWTRRSGNPDSDNMTYILDGMHIN